MQESPHQKTVLLIGASRGLGFAMVEEYLKRGWRVIATMQAWPPEWMYYVRRCNWPMTGSRCWWPRIN